MVLAAYVTEKPIRGRGVSARAFVFQRNAKGGDKREVWLLFSLLIITGYQTWLAAALGSVCDMEERG